MMSFTKDRLKETVSTLPDSPGVYMMKDMAGKIIYVGKAKSLKKRVRSYFQKMGNLDRKTRLMMEKARAIGHINADSEVEALILESNLIKEYKPRYNVNLKDDKKYPSIKITLDEPFPRVLVTRKIKKDGAKYFGPFTAATKMRTTLKTLRSIFPIRSCSYRLPDERPQRECLDFHIGKCMCPCMGRQSEEDYRSMIDEVCLFLTGKQEEVRRRVEERMREASRSQHFEQAAILRDRLLAIDAVNQRQRVLSPGLENYDVIAQSKSRNLACGVILKVREGKLLGIEHHYLSNIKDAEDGSILSLFLARYYMRDRDFPGELLLPFDFDDIELVRKWLGRNVTGRIRVSIPRRGEKRKILDLAKRNAELFLEEITIRQARKMERALRPLDELKEVLPLETRPDRLVCFDISNLGDSFAVGSMAVFTDGRPDKSGYRRFKIKTVDGQDDFAMMNEIIGRFAAKCVSGEEKTPDLIVVDGGKGQLSAALSALEDGGLEIPLIAIAKREEELFLPGEADGKRLSRRSAARALLIRLRDETHRFAVTYHRKERAKALTRSILEEVRGIGPIRKRYLLAAFDSIDAIAAATPDDLAEKGKIPLETAERLLDYLGEIDANR